VRLAAELVPAGADYYTDAANYWGRVGDEWLRHNRPTSHSELLSNIVRESIHYECMQAAISSGAEVSDGDGFAQERCCGGT